MLVRIVACASALPEPLAPMTAAARHPTTIESERSERVSTINGPATCSNCDVLPLR